MLRRPPTVIQLTSEDVMAYEDEKEAMRATAEGSDRLKQHGRNMKAGKGRQVLNPPLRSRNERIGAEHAQT